MNITFYSGFQKRENSTKVVATGSGVTSYALTGVLKEPCSIESPVVQIARLTSDASPAQYTYAYISDFSRYYFVDDWIWNTGRWECHMTEDYLASWKTQIGNITAYVTRAASDSNEYVQDHFYPTLVGPAITSVAMTSGYNGVAPSGGCYVLGIINKEGSTLDGGAVTYYALSPSEMRSMMEMLFSTEFLEDMGFPSTLAVGQQLTQDVVKAFFNPMDYIVSCIWFPFAYNTISSAAVADITFGWFTPDQITMTGHVVTQFAVSIPVTGTIPDHPQAALRGAFLNYAPYTEITLNIPPFGQIPFDTSFIGEGDSINGRVYVDVITGKCELRISNSENSNLPGTHVVTMAASSLGVPIPLAQLQDPMLGLASGAVNVISSALAGYASGGAAGAIAGAAKGVGSAIGEGLSSSGASLRIDGTGGTFLTNILPPIMTVKHFYIADENNTDFGRPLYENKTINTLSGYIECGHADVDFNAFASEKSRIEIYMTTGFFWE